MCLASVGDETTVLPVCVDDFNTTLCLHPVVRSSLFLQLAVTVSKLVPHLCLQSTVKFVLKAGCNYVSRFVFTAGCKHISKLVPQFVLTAHAAGCKVKFVFTWRRTAGCKDHRPSGFALTISIQLYACTRL